MIHLVELAYSQKIRLHNHLSESTEHTEENFFSMPEEIAVTEQILDILTNDGK